MIYSRTKYSFTLLAITLICCLPASKGIAQVYKWTDAQGKVHYSDKKIGDSAKAQNLDLGTMPAVKQVNTQEAKRYQNTRPSLYLLRSEMALDRLTTLRSPAKFAYFYFGGDCISPTVASYEEFTTRFKNSLPDADDLYRDEGLVFNKYNFRNNSAEYAIDNIKRVTDEEGNLPLKLHVSIIDMRINSCAPRQEQVDYSNKGRFGIGSFEKSNVWLQLQATISTVDDDIVLLNIIIEGSADKVDGHSGNIAHLVTAAYEQAITNLIANDKFVELLTPKSKTQKVNVTQTATPAQASGGILTRIADKMQFNAVKKSKVAEALSLTNPVRFSIVQYYADKGKWPSSFSDIEINGSDLHQQGLIDNAEIRLGGVLHLRLDKSTFGENEILQLIPKQTMGGQNIDWECRTSLDKAYWVGECMEQ